MDLSPRVCSLGVLGEPLVWESSLERGSEQTLEEDTQGLKCRFTRLLPARLPHALDSLSFSSDDGHRGGKWSVAAPRGQVMGLTGTPRLPSPWLNGCWGRCRLVFGTYQICELIFLQMHEEVPNRIPALTLQLSCLLAASQ